MVNGLPKPTRILQKMAPWAGLAVPRSFPCVIKVRSWAISLEPTTSGLPTGETYIDVYKVREREREREIERAREYLPYSSPNMFLPSGAQRVGQVRGALLDPRVQRPAARHFRSRACFWVACQWLWSGMRSKKAAFPCPFHLRDVMRQAHSFQVAGVANRSPRSPALGTANSGMMMSWRNAWGLAGPSTLPLSRASVGSAWEFSWWSSFGVLACLRRSQGK